MRALALLRATRAGAVAGAVLVAITCTNPDSPTAVGTRELEVSDGETLSALAHVASITVTLGSSRIDVGGRTRATAITLDSSGNPTGRSVRWLSSDASVARVSYFLGSVTGVNAGTAAIVAVADGVIGSAMLTVGPVVVPPPPPHPAPVASVTVTLGDSAIDVGDTTTAKAILRDSSNNILTGRTITGSSSNPLVATVDTATGIVVGVAPGTSDLVAVSEGVTGRATITVRPPPPPPATSVAIATQPGGAMSGAALAPQPVAQIRDANGNAVTSWNEPVTASIASGSGVLSGTTAATAVNGVATFANLVITGSGAHTLRFASGTLAPATSGSFDVSAPPPPPPPPAAMGCADPQPGWIWCDDFETDQLARYFEVATAGGSLARTSGVGLNGSYAIRSRFAAGQVNAGSLKLAFGRTPSSYFRPIDAGTRDYREVYWRVYLRNAPGWTGGGDKFARATVLASANWAQAMIAHVWSGTGSQLLIEPASGTDVTGNVRTTKYNDFANLRWLGSARGATPILDAAHANQWFCIESHVRLNTMGQSDGVFEYWVDGQLEARLTGLNWLGAYSAYGLNAIFLENYWNSGSPVAQERYFDDLVVSENPIGCLAATPPPPPPPLPPPPPPPSDTREPTNFVLITQRDFGAKVENGWQDRGDAAFSIQPDASAPRADKSVGQALFPAGYAAGSGPINTYYNISGSKTKLYVQLWLRISSNWQGQQAGINKVLFFWVAGGPSIYLNLQGSGTGPLVFRVNTQFPSAIQTKDFSLGQGRFGGRDIEAVRDRWYQWEVLLETNSASGVADGRIESWIDGVKFADSNVEVPAQDAFPGLIMWETGRSPYFSQVSWNPTWGGVGGTVTSDMTQRIDYIRVSGLP